jgi:hypothetical protein
MTTTTDPARWPMLRYRVDPWLFASGPILVFTWVLSIGVSVSTTAIGGTPISTGIAMPLALCVAVSTLPRSALGVVGAAVVGPIVVGALAAVSILVQMSATGLSYALALDPWASAGEVVLYVGLIAAAIAAVEAPSVRTRRAWLAPIVLGFAGYAVAWVVVGDSWTAALWSVGGPLWLLSVLINAKPNP